MKDPNLKPTQRNLQYKTKQQNLRNPQVHPPVTFFCRINSCFKMFKQIKIIFKQITSTWIHPRFLSYIELIFQDYTNYPKANTSGLLTAFLEAYLEKNYSGILQNIFFNSLRSIYSNTSNEFPCRGRYLGPGILTKKEKTMLHESWIEISFPFPLFKNLLRHTTNICGHVERHISIG